MLSFQLLSYWAAHLSSIHNAAVGVQLLQLAVGVHVRGLKGRVQLEALAASQQDVQVVMEVMMQATAGT